MLRVMLCVRCARTLATSARDLVLVLFVRRVSTTAVYFSHFCLKMTRNSTCDTQRVFLKRKFARAFSAKYSHRHESEEFLKSTRDEHEHAIHLNWWNDSCPRLSSALVGIHTIYTTNSARDTRRAYWFEFNLNNNYCSSFRACDCFYFRVCRQRQLHFDFGANSAKIVIGLNFILSVSCIFHRWKLQSNYNRSHATDPMAERHLHRTM